MPGTHIHGTQALLELVSLKGAQALAAGRLPQTHGPVPASPRGPGSHRHFNSPRTTQTYVPGKYAGSGRWPSSHRRMPSWPPERARLPSALRHTKCVDICPWKVRRQRPVAVSHNRMPSWPPERARLPSALKLTAYQLDVCPWKVRRQRPVAVSHNRMPSWPPRGLRSHQRSGSPRIHQMCVPGKCADTGRWPSPTAVRSYRSFPRRARLPSALKLTEDTQVVCPRKVRRHWPLAVSHSHKGPSLLPERARRHRHSAYRGQPGRLLLKGAQALAGRKSAGSDLFQKLLHLCFCRSLLGCFLEQRQRRVPIPSFYMQQGHRYIACHRYLLAARTFSNCCTNTSSVSSPRRQSTIPQIISRLKVMWIKLKCLLPHLLRLLGLPQVNQRKRLIVEGYLQVPQQIEALSAGMGILPRVCRSLVTSSRSPSW